MKGVSFLEPHFAQKLEKNTDQPNLRFWVLRMGKSSSNTVTIPQIEV